MKKRIACFLLTLIMLVSLVPVAALTASAASLSISAAAINVLKKMTPYKAECYQVADTQEFRIGYGTVCNEKGHKVDAQGNLVADTLDKDTGEVITVGHQTHTLEGEYEADAALRLALAEYDKKVNSFASSNGLSLTQYQHDALVIFSYDCGTAWMEGNGVLKTAIVNKAGTNELLNALMLYGNEERRLIEANMYLNSVYSNVVPSSYKTVTYSANGGTMAQGSTYRMYYDTTKTVSHIPSPTRSNHTFLGWYYQDSKNNYVWSANLTYACETKTLFALWQANGLAAENASNNPIVSYSLAASNLASAKIYSIPDVNSGTETGNVTATSILVDRDYIGSDGSRWAHFSGGWVIVTAGKNGIPSSDSESDVTVTVTNSYVNMRKNASIYSAQNGRWNQGDQLRIINTDSADGFLWGQVAQSANDNTPIGWVALLYTNWNTVKDTGTSAENSTNNSNVIATATITFNGYVNVRSDAGTDNRIVGALAKDETVNVYEIKTVNGHQWGRTTAGWFCMTYASVTMLTTSNSIVSDAGALDYAFTGSVAAAELKPHVQAGENTNLTGDTLASGTSVTLTNMVKVNGNSGTETWGKIIWRVDTDDDGVADTNKSGWIQISELSTGGTPIEIDAARFQVVSDVKVRENPDTAAASVFTITPGVEFETVEIQLVGENIWGKTFEIDFINAGQTEDSEEGEDPGENLGENPVDNKTEGYNGWINLSSKYVKRINAPTIESDKSNPTTGKVATVINTDSVRVRDYGATYGNVIGSLTRGTTVAVWESNEKGDWYKIDTNQNGTYDNEEDGWVFAQYLNITEASSDSSTNGGASSGSSASGITGTGIVANTYAGVNVRSGAGVGYAALGKLLPGTVVEILETKTVGASRWGRVTQGWICMDYVTMISYSDIPGNATTSDPSKGTAVSSLDDVEKTTTTAVYTGTVNAQTTVYKEMNKDSAVVRTVGVGDPITMYELITVTDLVHNEQEKEGESENTTGEIITTTRTSCWARVNEGYIYNPGQYVVLDALDEKVHTLTGSDTLNIREAAGTNNEKIGTLEKGDQVTVTSLEIISDKVWGQIETKQGVTGWIRLDYMSEGAYYVSTTSAPTVPTTPAPTIGSTGNTGTGGYVTNTSGYKYTGKVIRNGATTLKVRAMPSTSADVVTSLNTGASLVIYETTIAESMAWGRCDAGWVYLYYVDLTPSGGSAIDAKVVYNENTIAYTDSDCSAVAGTYSRMSVVDIYEVVGKMARTDLGWVNTDNLA